MAMGAGSGVLSGFAAWLVYEVFPEYHRSGVIHYCVWIGSLGIGTSMGTALALSIAKRWWLRLCLAAVFGIVCYSLVWVAILVVHDGILQSPIEAAVDTRLAIICGIVAALLAGAHQLAALRGRAVTRRRLVTIYLGTTAAGYVVLLAPGSAVLLEDVAALFPLVMGLTFGQWLVLSLARRIERRLGRGLEHAPRS
jgi:hypothetical protein